VEALRKELEDLQAEALAQIQRSAEAAQLENARVRFLGRKARLTAILRQLATLPAEDRPLIGALANQVKKAIEERIDGRRVAFESIPSAEVLRKDQIDVTLPGRRPSLGRLHPLTQIIREICGVFVEMGFAVMEGPEVEWDYYNFEALNIPEDHPARDMWDTFWIDPASARTSKPMLLRTHTSPMQIRIMEQTRPPIRVVVPGKCYRYEAVDASHESQFDQIEGLAVDEQITFADLKGTLHAFARRLFGKDRKVRFRCDYFPFVEPGVDMSIDCFLCKGAGCRLCKETGWLEILGAGMVHPNVLARVGYDPARYTGFAFGLGPARVAMLKYGIDDIRFFHGNDLRFLRQFP
jgi:phenylalanyl-tRNA synthetase alpha chain